MHLAIDIGNTNIVIAVHDGKLWTNTFRYESKDDQPAIFYINGLQEILLEWGMSAGDIEKTTISSVVPHLNDRIQQAVLAITGGTVHILGPDDFLNLNMHIPKVYEIGSDLVANAYAAMHKYGRDSLIIDFGTALTFTVVSAEHGIEGVTIAPGLLTAMQSLAGHTAQLPEVWLTWPSSALGKSTEEAIRSGILVGYYGLVKQLRHQILAEYTHITHTIGTGGLVTVLEPLQQELDVVDRVLTLDGIRLLGQQVG